MKLILKHEYDCNGEACGPLWVGDEPYLNGKWLSQSQAEQIAEQLKLQLEVF